MRKLCWFAAPCSAAIFLSVYLLPEDWLPPAGILCVLLSLTAFLFRGNTRWKAALVSLGLAFGFLWTSGYAAIFRAPARALAGETAEYTLTVTDYPKETRFGVSIPTKLTLEGAPAPKVLLYAGWDAKPLMPGDIISAQVRLAPSDFLRGEQFDYYQSRGIYLLGYTDIVTLEEHPTHIPPPYWPQELARRLKGSISEVFPADTAGFITALTTGDKGALPDGLYAAFQRTGLSHIVAVSGLHISFLASVLTLLLGRHRKRSFLAGMALVFFFAAMTGNSPSALRAAFMEGLLLLAPLLGREDDKPTTLSAILLLLLLQCPYAAASISLQLSFAAISGIYLISEPLALRWAKGLPKWDKGPKKAVRALLFFLITTLATTFGALLFTTPLSAWHFRSFSLAGPLTNLLTLWAVSGLFLGGLATALAGLFFPGLGGVLAWAVSWPARLVIGITKTISGWPFAAVSLTSIYLVGWFLLSYTLLLLCLFFRKRGLRPVIPCAICVLTLCAALVMNAWPIVSGALTITVLDVGQGSSTLFYSGGHTVLVDCGGNSADDPGDIAADHLQAMGTSKLDALVLTHYHADHAGGVPELLSRIDVSLLLLPNVEPEDPLRSEILSLAQRNNCEVEFLSEDAHITFGDASMTIYAPLGDGGANEEGLSVLCSAGDFDTLITGDMNHVVEHMLVKYKHLPDIELLVVGHHGSKSATSEELLLAATPEYAVISSGYNHYGHPALETLERLGAAGCGIYRTDQMGTVTFTLQGK